MKDNVTGGVIFIGAHLAIELAKDHGVLFETKAINNLDITIDCHIITAKHDILNILTLEK